MIKNIFKITCMILLMLTGVACTDLDLQPESEITAANVFNDEGSYKAFIAKIYAGLAVTGQQGPDGSPDIQAINEGFSSYLRQLWGAQVLSTDEAVIGWGDDGLPDFHYHTWTPANNFLTAMYNRVFFQISQVNEFLRETTDAKLAERGGKRNLKG